MPLEKLSNPVEYFVMTALQSWYLWVFLSLMIAVTTFVCYENTKSAESTRMGYTIKLNIPYYIYMVIVVMFVPIQFRGDGRFYTFLFGCNSIFILFFLSLLNPFYLRSTHFPYLEEVTNTKLFIFSFFELIVYLVVAGLHTLWGYYLIAWNQYNIWYYNENQQNRYKMAVYLTAVSILPVVLMCYNGLLQLVQRTTRIFRGTAINQLTENERSYRPEYQRYKLLKKQQISEERLLQKRIKENSGLNF